MRLLLDTHIFLWCETDDALLAPAFRQAIASLENQVFVSAVTVWEIAIKRASGKLSFHDSVAKAIREHPRYSPLPISPEHAEWAGALPELHRDPFDRLLVAQAQLEGMVLVSVDEQILRYQVPHL
jgi:PIN domain nuclease of toxin-antitoxin system